MSFLFLDEWGSYLGLDKILLPLEGFPAEREAVTAAFYIAECSDAVVKVLHISEDNENDIEFNKLKEIVIKKSKEINVKCEIEVLNEANPAKMILKREKGFDLIIMGGKRKLREELFGSVSSKVIRKSKKPVIVITSPTSNLDSIEKPFQNILVPISDLDEDKAAIKLAAILTSSATPRDFLITALHIVSLPPTTPTSASDDEVFNEEEKIFLKAVGELALNIMRPINPHVLIGRSIERSIVVFGKRRNYDLIILGERKKPHAFSRLLGAKSLYVARNATCAVAIIYKP